MSEPKRTRPSDDATRWVGTTIVIGAVVGGAMVLSGMEPRLALVAVIVAVIAGTAWLVAGLAPVALPVSWYGRQRMGANDWRARPDRRVQLLTARLRHTGRRSRRRPTSPRSALSTQPEQPDEIVESLIAVIDDHLLAEFGIDRRAQGTSAESAPVALGPELTRFVTEPAAALAMTRPRTLAHTIALIEAFTSSADVQIVPITDSGKTTP